ncbi:hypothetical protein MBLNU457_g2895t1 [Dothideomycetes sp. NU457]
MAEYQYQPVDYEDRELHKLNLEVLANPDEFENWETLVRAAETLDGGLNRNSSAQSITAARDVYDRFLAKFPLFFGYWKKYADLEFAIAGTEAAEMVYERGVASIGISVDLWANYCGFKVETCHDGDIIRELFERAAESVGLDFLAHPFWDKYIELEERLDRHDRIFDLLSRIITIPLHQYARYFERYRQLASSQPIEKLASPEELQAFSTEVGQALGINSGNPHDYERELRARLDQHHLEIFSRTQAETTKRWTYEQEIKRPYFHVTELDESQLINWQKYLDFEEAEGDYRRTAFLYERCLVTAAHYDEFWQRYARWMLAQDGKEEEVRNILQRAGCIYTPIARPAMRLQWALFEESCNRSTVAAAIYEAILIAMPDYQDAIICLANLQRRQQGDEAAIGVYEHYLAASECSSATKGALVAEMARLAWQSSGNSDEGRTIFEEHKQSHLDSEPYWSGYLRFEVDQTTTPQTKTAQSKRIQAVHQELRRSSRLSADAVKNLSQQYLGFLSQSGSPGAAKEYMTLDAEINGPASIVPSMREKNVKAEKAAEKAASLSKANGHPV